MLGKRKVLHFTMCQMVDFFYLQLIIEMLQPVIPTSIAKFLFLLFQFSFNLKDAFETKIPVALTHPTM